MPCGTTIFFFGPVKDDLIDLFSFSLGPISLGAVILTAVLICGFCFIFAGEVLESIMKSPLYQGLFPRVRYMPVFQLQSASPRYHRFSKMLEWLATQRRSLRNKYDPALRRYFRAYTMSRPSDGQHRRCIPVFNELSVQH